MDLADLLYHIFDLFAELPNKAVSLFSQAKYQHGFLWYTRVDNKVSTDIADVEDIQPNYAIPLNSLPYLLIR